jgi:hypothetical protein
MAKRNDFGHLVKNTGNIEILYLAIWEIRGDS